MQPSLLDLPIPAVSDQDVAQLIAALSGRGWIKAKALALTLGCDDRTIRARANASEGRIVSGQQGYALIESVTVEEANRAANWLEHQAKEMARRAAEIRRAMHRRWAA